MDNYIRSQFFSRQGKATKHLFNSFKSSSHRELEPKAEPSSISINPTQLLEKLIKDRNQDELTKNSQSPSSFFKVVGRDFSLSESSSPGAGHYYPNYSYLDARVNQGPKYFKPTVNKKIPKIYLPGCLNENLQCRVPKSDPYGEVSPGLNRTVHSVEEYETKIGTLRSFTPIPEKLQSKVASPIKFSVQKPRDPFIKSDSGPHEKRFDYFPSKKDMSLKFERPQSVDFGKMSPRIDYPVKSTTGPYDKNPEYTMPKLVKNVPDFAKQIKRKPLVLEHILRNPDFPDLKKYDKAFQKLGNVKGPKKLPLMSTVTARDDSMYKSTDAYVNSKNSKS